VKKAARGSDTLQEIAFPSRIAAAHRV